MNIISSNNLKKNKNIKKLNKKINKESTFDLQKKIKELKLKKKMLKKEAKKKKSK